MNVETLRCLEVVMGPDRHPVAAVAQRPLPTPGEGEVLVRVQWSSLNYKDALVTTGQLGMEPKYPHVPGIDASGEVVSSRADQFAPGQRVIVTSYDLGVGRPGGWSDYICVPHEWIVPLPAGLGSCEAMILGTAGLTAGLCVDALQQHGITPDRGEILVTGATGGVGSLAVRLLAHLGYRVVAVTGKASMAEMLKRCGAHEIIAREAFQDDSPKPLLKGRWAGVVDCVGGKMLAQAIRQTQPQGCVTACGLVGGTDLPLTIFPFILRGVSLVGIDSVYCPYERRAAIWEKLAGPWKLPTLGEYVTIVTLDALPLLVARMLRGELAGRVVVSLAK